MRQMSHQTGTQIAETTKMTTARRSGPATPKPRPATGRSTTPTCASQYPRKNPSQFNGSPPRRRSHRGNGTSRQKNPAGSGRSTSASGLPSFSPVKRSDDVPGSWRGEGNRSLKPEANGRVEAACDQIADREREKISPAMRAIESQDPDRHLIGFEHRLKGRDRIKDKVCRGMRNFGRSPEQAISRVPDAIRYTFEYREARYTQGVWTDIGRLKDKASSSTNYGMHGRRISTRESTVSGSIQTVANGSRYSSTLASASRPSNSHILPTNG